MKHTLLALAIGSALAASSVSAQAGLLDSATKAWTYVHSATNTNAANVTTSGFLSEIVTYDKAQNQLWVSGVTGVDVLNASTGSRLGHIDISSFGSVNSVAISNGVAALAIESTNRTGNGIVQLYDTTTRSLLSGTNTITVGALPDMLTFTPDGSKLLVANEASPTTYGALSSATGTFPRSYGASSTDPVGSVSIINMNTRTVVATANPNTAVRTGSNIRTNTGMDFEPEYIAVNAAGTQAYVSLQEANAMGVLDLATGTFSKVVGLGLKDFSLPGNRMDPLNNGTVNLISPAARGLYMPDGMATFSSNGQTFIAMANEGDYREDDGDRSNASAAGLNAAAPLNNLRVSNTDSSAGNLIAAGGRSFSIRDADGNLVYDSGEILDREAAALGIYDDSRSRDKGVEPEGMEIMTINGRTVAFVGLERTTKSAVAAFDITDPAHSVYLTMLTSDGEQAPEGLKGYEQNGKYYLAWSAEGGSINPGNRTTVFELASVNAAVPEPETYALLLAGAGVLGAMARRSKAA
jgi:hypothetical protein